MAFAPACGGCDDATRDGTYKGPNDTLVVVEGGGIRKIHIHSVGNAGFTFNPWVVTRESFPPLPVDGDMFTVEHPAATIRGTFVSHCRIEGTWQNGDVTGPWHAEK